MMLRAISQDSATIEFRVRYAETDQMGVVYHANYLVWCEIGRTELIRRRGTPYAQLEREGVVLAVTEAELRFHDSARYDDLVRVEAWVEEVKTRGVTFGYLIGRVGDDGAASRLVSARTKLIALDETGRTRRLPPHVADALRGGA